MRVPLQVVCVYCDATEGAVSSVGQTFGDWKCPACGRENLCIVDLSFTVGYQILLRAEQEHNQGEFWLAILLSAMAIDSELGRLFIKWTSIDKMANSGNHEFWEEARKKEISPFELLKKRAEKKFQNKFRSVVAKISCVANLLDPCGLDAFVRSSEFALLIQKRFPSLVIGDLAACIQAAVFEPRNEIAHQGRSERPELESANAYNIAKIVIDILATMDKQRRLALKF